jgi:hypothetical protein
MYIHLTLLKQSNQGGMVPKCRPSADGGNVTVLVGEYLLENIYVEDRSCEAVYKVTHWPGLPQMQCFNSRAALEFAY